MKTPEHRERIAKQFSGPKSADHRRNIGLARKGRPAWNRGLKTGPQGWSAKRIASRALFLSDPTRYASYIAKCRANGMKSVQVQARRKSSCPEHYIKGWLDAQRIDYVYQHATEFGIVDFYVPSLRLVIEYDGKFWHQKYRDKDARRDENLVKAGYCVVRLDDLARMDILRGAMVARKEAS
jgi:very-short-patch-repair endonuclease